MKASLEPALSQVSIGQRILWSLGRIGIAPSDTDEIRLQKTLLLISTVSMAFLGMVWGGIYYYYDQPLAASIPWAYAAASSVSIVIFGLSHRYRFFRFSQLLFSLLLPFFLMVALGGFVKSSAVVLWSLTCPLGALVFVGRRQALGWFLAFLGLVACGFVVAEFVHPAHQLPPAVITAFFVLNISGTSVVAFVLLHRFVNEREKAHKAQHETLQRLIETQDQLIQQEKMASLGQLTAGIAHEIKNPLNFVNNFSHLSVELANELREEIEANKDKTFAEVGDDLEDLLNDLRQNAEKINEHGRRVDDIVRAMMQHASGSSGTRNLTDVNALVEEYVNLSYHGMCAQTPDFSVSIERDYDEAAGSITMVPQEMGRVFLNMLNNAFYAVHERAASVNGPYAPVVSVSTKHHNGQVAIRIEDNGLGIPEGVLDKIFEPFFTTKPTGTGTGLGLSLSYDIITQGHGGTLTVESEEGRGATFIVTLPVKKTETASSS